MNAERARALLAGPPTSPTNPPPPGASRKVDRDRVLRHPDLAAKLTEPPLNYANPGQWTGYIPPTTFGGALNTAAQRDALYELAREAYRRELDSQTPASTTASEDAATASGKERW